MLKVIYKWERTRYAREDAGRSFRNQRERDVRYITPRWYDAVTSREETGYFEAMGAEVIRRGVPVTGIDNTSPDGLRKIVETFEQIGIEHAVRSAGPVELEALRAAERQRVIPVVDEGGGRLVLRFGDESARADYDMTAREWVGGGR